MTQNEVLWKYLEKNDYITQIQAADKFGILRLSERARELDLFSFPVHFVTRSKKRGRCAGYTRWVGVKNAMEIVYKYTKEG
jgi:hypothetical protein